MTRARIKKIKYKIASDLNRDGMSLEVENDAGDVIMEVFYSDIDSSFEINTFGNSISIEIVNQASEIAKIRLVKS